MRTPGCRSNRGSASSVALRTTWAPAGVPVGVALAPLERAERAQLAQTVASLEAADAEPAIAALRERSRVLAPVLGRLRTLDEEGTLELPFEEVVSSLAHMAVNRVLKRGGNVDEARVHHALVRIYEGEIARERSGVACDPVEG